MFGDLLAQIAAAFGCDQFIPDFRKGGTVDANRLRKETVLRQFKKALGPALDRRFRGQLGFVRAPI